MQDTSSHVSKKKKRLNLEDSALRNCAACKMCGPVRKEQLAAKYWLTNVIVLHG